MGDLVEPTADAIVLANRPRLARQHEESRLERVLGILLVAQHAAAGGQHHRPMPAHQLGECGFLPLEREAVEQLAIG